MPISGRFREMRSRISELRMHLLPKNWSPTGSYSERELDRTRGYRLLVHAEFESYLEDVVRDVTLRSIRKWKQNQKPSWVIVSFLAAYHSSWSVGDDISNDEIITLAKNRTSASDSVNEVIDIAHRQFLRILNKNHGIKEANVKKLILPVGIDLSDLDAGWLPTLDSFGVFRGSIAHNTKSATNQDDPHDAFNVTKILVDGFKTLDRLLFEIQRK